jgi:O-acetyl-ADP-ribose deacetylase
MNDRIAVVKGDITSLKVDVIVNAANPSLLGGGGVDGAIHRAAGLELLEECRKLNGCPAGEAKITSAYRLPATWVIHAVGPVWQGGNADEDRLLARCYRNALMLAQRCFARTIAFPSISTGAYHFPLHRASGIAMREIKNFLRENTSFEQIILVCFDNDTYQAYQDLLED